MKEPTPVEMVNYSTCAQRFKIMRMRIVMLKH